MRALRLGYAALLLGALLARPLHAKDNDDRRTALRLSQRALKLFEAGQYREAIDRFEAAQAVYGHRSNLYYIGEAHRRLNDRRRSHKAYAQYAALLDEAARAQFLPKLERLRWEAACKLSLASTPGDAVVSVDGGPRGRTPSDGSPLVLSVEGGRRRIRIERAQHRPIERTVDAEFGEPIALHVMLQSSSHPSSRPTRRPPPFSPIFRPTAVRPAPPLPVVLSRHGVFVNAAIGISIADYGTRTLKTGPAILAGLEGGYLLRWRRFALCLSASLHYTPVSEAGTGEQAGFVIPTVGVGGRVHLLPAPSTAALPRLWLELRFAVGAALLVGADEGSFFFSKASEVSGVFATPILRPSLAVGFAVWRGFTLVLVPASLEYSPRHTEFAPEISRTLRYGALLLLGWER